MGDAEGPPLPEEEGHVEKFAKGIPEDCPPPDAAPANGQVFRLVKVNPVTADDLRTLVELDQIIAERLCECHGLSVFSDQEDAASYADKFPYLGTMVAAAILSPEHGRMRPTPRRGNSHMTWWPYASVVRHELFSVVADLGGEDVGD